MIPNEEAFDGKDAEAGVHERVQGGGRAVGDEWWLGADGGGTAFIYFVKDIGNPVKVGAARWSATELEARFPISAEFPMDFELQFSDKEITPWGGMALMKRMLDCMGMDATLKDLELPQPGSNWGYVPEQLFMQFMLSVWCSANRFEHGEVTRHDGVLQQLFGWTQMANFKAVPHPAQCQRVANEEPCRSNCRELESFLERRLISMPPTTLNMICV